MPRPLMPDRLLVVAVAILVLLGIAMVWSASAIVTMVKIGSPFHFLVRQVIWAVIGFAGLTAAYFIDYRLYRRLAMPAFLGCAVLLVLVLIPGVGSVKAGVHRWFQLGPISFQPSELAKLASIVLLAASISVSGGRLKEFGGGLAPNLFMIGGLCFLIFWEPDLGSTVTIFAVSVIILFLGGARFRHILLVGAAALPVLAASLIFRPYQMKRWMVFLDPWKDPDHSGFQIIQSMVALGHGGINGLGLGDGRQKLFFLPAAHTDFVLAVIGEEMGLLGVLAVFLLFAVFWWRGVRIARGAPDVFGRFLALGITVMIVFQAAVNAGVVVGLLPTKGLTMPFLSYGGTSLAVNLFAVGMLLNISQYRAEGL